MSSPMHNIKIQLARALDDNMHTRQWHNTVDYLIIGMILVSTTEIFLSTFDISPRLRHVLKWVDMACLTFFLVEVSLRIWVAPLINPLYHGFRGRIRYCLTFHGFVDVVSTYPFFLGSILPFPTEALRVLRLTRAMRLFRITRYTKSFRLLSASISQKKRELWISLQFLVIVTVILSLLLFFFEHEAQPEIYNNGFASVSWAFAQYIGDPGGFAGTPPVTFWGRAIACAVGILGIAIVAVPAGIIGAGFTEAIEKEAHRNELEENRRKLHNAFERKLDRPSGYQRVPVFRTITDISARVGLTDKEIIEVCSADTRFRLGNLASTIPLVKNPMDRLAVEVAHINTAYGCCIDRGSNVTIISPSGFVDFGTTNFFYYLSKIGGFNWISRETGERAPYRSGYLIDNAHAGEQNLQAYLADIARLMDRPKAWSITTLIASGAAEPEYDDSQIHIGIGGPKGDTGMEQHNLVNDMETFMQFYGRLSQDMDQEFGLHTDCQKYHATDTGRLFHRFLQLRPDSNNLVLRICWHQALWNPENMLIARKLAIIIADTLGTGADRVGTDPTLRIKDIGFRGY